ncbi:MAG: hypothetical protein A3K14_00905 [Sulfurimonas sp. RIFCSPLOWO2_12_FULL_36_74]|uniref:type II toxin-antitoxin system VapC family toxin n=1 Tax=Sulfurimonas sp. RIFCSPLOWO2_12_36_12 TaxID=1802253 RepID=UPI0008C7C41C|nr:type II toxin-antitoxin system VapC family toxin [Sulfurimonas sp. RIFCSPLOWO2_12_36_12]OHD98239.1 MAG: hypothetical protein A3J26_00095 [Sulfurimonas sp. RIFCSPLOWO2_02_FULL_36_28]OHE02577.1 MAG: hypothetical protein A2W82_06240 [Sulfurimonas sp. RIFCSPLOWO2_12_36_12]OHE05406.1 MAG: hypothetical protein A3K14_00905 [Sulfurimonas sp. RIFCSPLOWO2_12_FULL_36_74]
MSKKIFLDTNVVADIIDAKRAGHQRAMELVERAIYDDFALCVSEDMLTTLFYISKEKAKTLEFFKNVVFVDWEILNFSKEILFEGVELAQGGNLDLEDVLQCLCAKQSGCTAIITNDGKFFNCGLESFSVEQFLKTTP